MDCGPACLKIISKHYQKTFSLKYLRDRCYITREGVSLFDIGRAAEDIGFRTLAIKVGFEDLLKKMPPAFGGTLEAKAFYCCLQNYTYKDLCF